ncbi:MAG: type II secretion system GspH family protein [Acidobacteriota bacterium]|nr:type II secretion system GspH family protein [Acidobacteriota bacterium]
MRSFDVGEKFDVDEKKRPSLIGWRARAQAGSVPLSPLSHLSGGYTLIELIIVMAIISILLATAVPMYQKSLTRTKESLLKNNLFTLRTVIDEYTFDKQKAPQTLQDLVDQGYLRGVPIDPITGNNQSWRVIMEDAISSVDQTQPGIYDVRSGSDLKSLEGNAYSEW